MKCLIWGCNEKAIHGRIPRQQDSVDKTTNYQYNKNDELLSEATPENSGNKQITNYWYDLNGNQIAKSYANVVTNGANVVVPIEPSSAVPEASAGVSATDTPNTTATN